MAVTPNSGEPRYAGSFGGVENLTNSTATGLQTVSLAYPVSTISGGTATGFAINRYLLPTSGAVEGQEKTIIMLATGEAGIVLSGTATGMLIVSAANDYVRMRYQNELWVQVDVGSATLATATGTA